MADILANLNLGLARWATLGEAERERLSAQVRFAEFLCGRHPAQARRWQRLIGQAVDGVTQAAAGSPEGLTAAVRQAEKALAPLAATAKSYTLYCVGHAHIDMNWMWSWPETVAVTNDTFTTVLRLLEEYPGFTFSQSQASVYRIIEEHNPEMLRRIAERVREGRWEVTASHWVECEKNLVSGEALTRHLLYTRRYMQELFGLAPEDVPIDWAPDTFGHAWTVPGYLARGGIRFVYMHRPGTHTPPQPRPQAFWWQGVDGSRVLVLNDMKRGYNGTIGPAVVPTCLQDVCSETGLTFAAYVYGVGDHGGGPTRRDLERLREMDTWPIFPRFKGAAAREVFERLEKEGGKLPVINDELNSEFTGCYTTQTLIKKANRYAEKRLVDAEAAAALADRLTGCGYRAHDLVGAWRDTLFSHFHDIIPGSGVHDTRTYTHGLYQKTMATTGSIEVNALRALANQVDTSGALPVVPAGLPALRAPRAAGGGVGFGSANGAVTQYGMAESGGDRPVLLFNPLARERREVVEAVVWEHAWGWQNLDPAQLPFAVQGPDGVTLPAQVIEPGNYWGHRFVRLAFPAIVPAAGYAVYMVKEEACAPVAAAAVRLLGHRHPCSYAFVERSPEGIENELVRLDLDPQTGGICRLTDKQNGLDLITPDRPAALLEYGIERAHGMTAWTIEHTGGWQPLKVIQIARRLNGPYKATMDVRLRVNASDLTLTYELRAGDPTLYLHIRGVWCERGTPEVGIPVLRFSVPLNLPQPEMHYEIPFGAIQRDERGGMEVPALRWAAITTAEGGCLLLNDSKHGHSCADGRLNLTLIRSSYDPDILPEIGQHEIHLGLRPVGRYDATAAIEAARAFNHELRVVNTDAHPGRLPLSAGLVTCRGTGVVLDSIKRAEDGDGLIVRLHETAGTAATATIQCSELLGTLKSVCGTDLMERELPKSTCKARSNRFTARLPACGILSLRLRFG